MRWLNFEKHSSIITDYRSQIQSVDKHRKLCANRKGNSVKTMRSVRIAQICKMCANRNEKSVKHSRNAPTYSILYESQRNFCETLAIRTNLWNLCESQENFLKKRENCTNLWNLWELHLKTCESLQYVRTAAICAILYLWFATLHVVEKL